MIQLRAEHLQSLEELFRNAPAKANTVAARAINRAALAARTQAARSARETYVIKHGDIISTIKIKKATPIDLKAQVKSEGSALKLLKFRVRPNTPAPRRKAPILVGVKKGTSKPFKGGFVAQMRSGHMNVFTRTTKKRLPIQGHYGPSIPQMLGNESVVRYVENKATEVLDKRFEHELSHMLRGG